MPGGERYSFLCRSPLVACDGAKAGQSHFNNGHSAFPPVGSDLQPPHANFGFSLNCCQNWHGGCKVFRPTLHVIPLFHGDRTLCCHADLYNSLIVHALCVRGPPSGTVGRSRFFSQDAAYFIAGHTYSGGQFCATVSLVTPA